ncbi:MAG: BACON domain-containing protein [Candidatus Aminicenantales bacterium]
MVTVGKSQGRHFIKTLFNKTLNKKRMKRWGQRGAIFLAIILVFFPYLMSAVNVSNSPGTSSVCPRVAVDSSGQVHVIWVELSGSSSGDLYYSRGNRDATQWTMPVNLSNSNSVYCPSLMMAGIDVDASNRVYVVYVNGNQIRLRIYADGVWSNPVVLDERGGVDAPRVAVSPEGDIYSVWWAMSTYRVYSRARVGGTWEEVREISQHQSKFPDIAVGRNIVAATWADKNVSADTYQTAYTERGRSLNVSWSQPQWVFPSAYSQKHQAIEFDSNDVPHLIWTDEVGAERILQYTYRAGGGFVSPLPLSPSELLHYPNLAEAKDNLFAAWQVGVYGNGSAVGFNSKVGGTWEGSAYVPNSQGCTYSDVGVSPNGDRVYYVWDTYAGSPGDIFIHVRVYQPSGIPLYVRGKVRTPDGNGLSGVLMQGLPSSPQTSSSGEYNDVVYSGWSGTVVPSKAGYTFSPASRSYTSLMANQLDQDFTASASGCSFSISPVTFYFSQAGGNGSVNVAAGSGCSWSAQSNAGWITITSGSSGTGNGTVQFSVNSNSAEVRTGTMIVAGQTVIIHQAGQIKYNTASPYIILPECIWAPASGSGNWATDVQIVDVTGGSMVSVYFNYGNGQRRGPITVWNNQAGGLSCIRFNNFLSLLGSVDSGFQYYGRVGAVEFITQDANHRLQVNARIYNGNYSKTLPGIIPSEENTVSTARSMLLSFMVSNSTYRSSCGFFNPTSNSLTCEFRLYDSQGNLIGSPFTKNFQGYDFQSFNPFTEAGRAYPNWSYEQAYLVVSGISGSGVLIGFGATANNASNDPASHLGLQAQGDLDNSPSNYIVLPECIWAQAYGGGTWLTEVQIIDLTGGTSVAVYFSYGGGARRGPFTIWTNTQGAGKSILFSNFLSSLGAVDTAFNYYGRVGAVEFITQDSDHKILVSARTRNGNYAKTFQGLKKADGTTADPSRQMTILDLINNANFRSSCGFFNASADALTVEFRLVDGEGKTIGSVFSKSFAGYDFKAFNPFTEAGIPYPSFAFNNVVLVIRPLTGSGKLISFGSTANNTSNDPAAHWALRY